MCVCERERERERERDRPLPLTVAEVLWQERLVRVKLSLANTLVAMQVRR